MTLIDHCTGWAEAFPLKDKTNASVWQAWATHVVPRHGAPEVLITDNGQEFKATAWRTYLKQLGVEHRTTTPVHPQSNGRTERFNRTLKELLAKSVNNYTPDWEDRLGDCLAAYRVSVSDVTGHTPFFLLYGRRVRTPLTRLLQPRTANHFGNRLDDLSSALQKARHATADSRKYNRQRLANRADAKDIHVGDTVLLKAEERLTLTSRWDPQWEVVRVRGPVLWLRQQQNGKLRVANREKVKLVDPHLNWDEITPRPRRTQRRPRAVIGGAPIIRPPQTPPERAGTRRSGGVRTFTDAANGRAFTGRLTRAPSGRHRHSSVARFPHLFHPLGTFRGIGTLLSNYGFPTTGQPLPLSVDINSPRGRMGRQTAYKFSAP